MEKLEKIRADEELLIDAQTTPTGREIHRSSEILQGYLGSIYRCNLLVRRGKVDEYNKVLERVKGFELELRKYLGGLRKAKREGRGSA
jgi:hypothetical protein